MDIELLSTGVVSSCWNRSL